jgi:hypothetical protein
MVEFKHATQATAADAGTGQIRKAQWNEPHSLTMAGERLLGRTAADAGDAEEVSVGPGLTLAQGELDTAVQITVSTSEPSGGDDGDVWFVVEE